MSKSLHTGSQTLHIRISGCEYHKIMYATLLGFCIVMLSFVIVVGILKRPEEAQGREEEGEVHGKGAGTGGGALQDSEVHLVRHSLQHPLPCPELS